jgi:cyclopropane-fatty-acyl-phospholipid synthase
MWEFYLAVCDMSFEFANLVVFQCQLAKQHDSVPVTRDYLYSMGAD